MAIVFTDVVGYSAITKRDEAGAVRIREAHRDLVRTLASLSEFIGTSWESPLARAAIIEFLAPDAGHVERRVLMHFLGNCGPCPGATGSRSSGRWRA